MDLLNQPIDVSTVFFDPANECFVPGPVTHFDAATGTGTIQWNYHRWTEDWSFIKIGRHLQQREKREIFWHDHEVHPQYSFSISFINARTFRLRLKTSSTQQAEYPSLVLDGEPQAGKPWPTKETNDKIIYTSEHGTVTIDRKSWKIDICDASGRILTSSLGAELLSSLHHKTIPFLFIKRASDYSRSIAASFSLAPGEKIVGGGESFTALNKRGQKLVLWTTDAQSAGTAQQYKPVPFFMSNRGYGMFFHTTTPVTMDIGNRFDGINTVFVGEDQLDVFVFLGSPKEILTEYTALTGRSPVPPVWTFGLWMSRFTYRSATEVEEVAEKLREHKIPCDVIHIDAGWFEKGIDCDFRFHAATFPDPARMIAGLRKNGFRTSVWQLPYFTPNNPLYSEIVAKKLFVKDGNGNVPTEDAVLDFSNPEAVSWYTHKIKTLLDLGISAIKADFGEAAPLRGSFASGRSGFYEHNPYPLRYTQSLYSIMQEANVDPVIWARSAWAGGQRYPIHWSGDPEVSDMGLAGTLRAGLSLGLSGFSFWSHDIGGFSATPTEELFARWAVFGLFTSHSRVHGFPPREPWQFSDQFLATFRAITEMKYRLMPYIMEESKICAANGWPMTRALLFEYPHDPIAWQIEDQYLFGSKIMVAPLMEANIKDRLVYLPEGKWTDYLSRKVYEGGRYIQIGTGTIPGIILFKSGSTIPHIPLAQSTDFMDWSEVQPVQF